MDAMNKPDIPVTSHACVSPSVFPGHTFAGPTRGRRSAEVQATKKVKACFTFADGLSEEELREKKKKKISIDRKRQARRRRGAMGQGGLVLHQSDASIVASSQSNLPAKALDFGPYTIRPLQAQTVVANSCQDFIVLSPDDPGVAIAYVPEVAGPQANDKYEVAMLLPSPSTNAASEDIHVVANDSESKQEFGTFDFEDFFVLPPDEPVVAIAYVPEVAGPQANDKYGVAMLSPSPSTIAASEDIHVVANDSESKQEFGTFDFEDFFVLPSDEPGVAIAYVPEGAEPQANNNHEVPMLSSSFSTDAAIEDIPLGMYIDEDAIERYFNCLRYIDGESALSEAP